MKTILIIRPAGPHTRAVLQGCEVIETSVEHLSLVASQRATIETKLLGAVILEDLRAADLPPLVSRAVRAGIKPGVSCPFVTRWTNPNTDDNL